MTLRLYDTARRSVEKFVPLQPGRASIYLCGATVQSPPHIGHMRSGLVFDVLCRWLEHHGLDVTFVRNVTDIDDKILRRAEHEDVPWWVIAFRNERAFADAYAVLGCRSPTAEPRATGHMTQMVELVQQLTERGHGYVAEGDVYFSVTSLPTYGTLSGQRLEDVQPAADFDRAGKRDSRDFALWKAAKPGEPSWPTPWGRGRPGWHLECSAMAHAYLGPQFDIHGGGVDLVFPHHENEVAQSRGVGHAFARSWMHNAWVTTSGEKMSKSLGNSLLVSEVVRRVRPVELRYYLISAHYRSHMEYSDAALHEAGAALRRVEGFLRRASQEVDGQATGHTLPAAFVGAMNDDLAVSSALAVLHDTVRSGNAALAKGDRAALLAAYASAVAMTDVLGINPLASAWQAPTSEDFRLRTALGAVVELALQQREQARQRQDYAEADVLRKQMLRAGVDVEDTPHGPRWSLAEPTSSERRADGR